jgi:predicted enzyme related to lactoylglutathione lyase
MAVLMPTTTRTAAPFIWYELLTSDHAAAFTFYSRVLGWTVAKTPFASPEYTIASAGPFNVGGLMTLPTDACAAGARPCWMAYLGVADVEATIAHVVDAGGSVTRAPSDIPGVGRWAMLADPQGAMFIVMKPISSEPLPVVPDGTPGTVRWRELHAANGREAFAWYTKQFGWTPTGEIDMGVMGAYRMFSTGELAEGGIMTKMSDTPKPYWTFYFAVDGLDAAVDRVNAAGGRVLLAQHEVSGPMWIAYLADPQGATFGLVANNR